jgi:hypothetical protein
LVATPSRLLLKRAAAVEKIVRFGIFSNRTIFFVVERFGESAGVFLFFLQKIFENFRNFWAEIDDSVAFRVDPSC